MYPLRRNEGMQSSVKAISADQPVVKMVRTQSPRSQDFISDFEISSDVTTMYGVRLIKSSPEGLFVTFNTGVSAAQIFGFYAHFDGKKSLFISNPYGGDPVYLPAKTNGYENQNTPHPSNPMVLSGDVEALIAQCLEKRVSDVHINPRQTRVHVDCRVDGIVNELGVMNSDTWNRVSVQLKVRAELDIAETRRPQSGSFQTTWNGNTFDIRISTHPTVNGERVSMRFLLDSMAEYNLETLGFSEARRCEIAETLTKRNGVFLVTGPTGSGKTTTLYGLVSHLYKQGFRSILSLEDPVEYTSQYVSQSSINNAIDFTYANGLRSILRQDPEVVLLGEIRDEETAKLAYRAAMTGVLVLATVHAGSIQGVVSRVLDLGVTLPQITQHSLGIINQRLVRKSCACSSKICAACGDTGFKGRMVIDEFARMPSFHNHTRSMNMSDVMAWIENSQEESILEHMWRLLCLKTTTFDELQRVLGSISAFLTGVTNENVSRI